MVPGGVVTWVPSKGNWPNKGSIPRAPFLVLLGTGEQTLSAWCFFLCPDSGDIEQCQEVLDTSGALCTEAVVLCTEAV